MCGVAGVLGRSDPSDLESASALGAGLAHRGPDGLRVEPFEAAVLAHARLSIIDLEGGWQPLRAAGSVVVGNGEIYNYRELTAEFGLGEALTTGSDFEPLLHLYAREGPRAFQRLRGMYAFCLLGCDGRAWLVRDPFGIKPLHVLQKPDRLLFASEPAPLWRAAGVRGTLSDAQKEDLLELNYLLPGLDEISGVRALGPGSVAEVRDGQLQAAEVRRPLPAPVGLRAPDVRGAVAALDQVLENSVAAHQRSDVPYGLFLSGGLDSAAVAVMMARLNPRPVTAFTCGFAASGVADERPKAERLARRLDLDWREISFGEEDFLRLAPLAAAALDQPTSDFAVLPTLKLAEAAQGVLKVVLTGEGGDELFAGYGRYRRALRSPLWGGRPAEPQRNPDLPRLREARDEGAGALARWRRLARDAAPAAADPLARAQAADIAIWLPNDLLLKLDRSLMAYGLEGRTPFLDPEVAAFAASLPPRLKVRGRHGKWLLRTWLAGVCPESGPWSRKRGFTVPVEAFIAPHAAEVGRRIAASRFARETFAEGAVEAVFSEPARAGARWPLLFLALWTAIHAEGATPAEAGTTLLPP